jgi:hypothetical protein
MNENRVSYRVRAPNDRSQPTIARHPHRHHKNKAIEPHTMIIIVRKLGGLFYRPMRQNSSIQINYIK